MKSVFANKIVAVAMTLVVLVSTMPLTVSIHFCKDKLVDVGLFSKVSCKDEAEVPSEKDCSLSKSDCCSNAILSISPQKELQNTSVGTTLKTKVFLACFIVSYVNLNSSLRTKIPTHKSYKPPLLFLNIQKLFQVFIL